MAEQTVWKKAVETVELTDTGDILVPLKRVQEQYATRACEMYEKSIGHENAAEMRATADFYKQQAENIAGLL